MYESNTIRVITKGHTETNFVSATFRASVTTTAQTGPAAKELAQGQIKAIKKVIADKAEVAGIDTERLKTTFAVSTHTHRQTGEFNGYKAVYTILFTGKNVAEAIAVHDALTSIEGVEAPTPVFNLDSPSDTHAAAFKVAADRAKVRFADQCKALGLDPDKFVIQSWSVQEDESGGKFLSYTNSATAEPVGIVPGKASLDMTVVFMYGRA